MMKQNEDRKKEVLQTVIFTGILVAVFVLLIRLIWPEGCFYGSTTDWYSQHVTLAERSGKYVFRRKPWHRPGFPWVAEATDFSLPIMAIIGRTLS